MPTKYSLNFRSTAGAWGETAPSGAVLGDLYPATIAGLTCGWSNAVTRADYAGATNAKLSGRNSINSGSAFFRVDLPLGPGTYRVWLALSALSSTTTTAFIVRDGAGTALRTVGSTSVTGDGNPASAFVMDASGAVIPYNTYISTDGGTFFEFTATSDHIRIERNGVAIQLNNVMLESQIADLDPATLTTEFGTGTHSGSIHPKEPAGHRIGRLTAPTGTQSFSLIAGSPYFNLEVDGANTWLVTTSTRIPDAWTGTVTVRQTSGEQTGDTNFSLTAGTLDRPVTGVLGQVSSETLVQRARVKSVMDAECWPGYQGQTLATDQIVTGRADFVTKFNALSTAGWHRLRLQNGDYTGAGTLAAKDWIANGGGVVIEPDTGHDPQFSAVLESCNQRGVHLRGLRLVPVLDGVGGLFNVGTSAPYPVYRFEGIRGGFFFGSGYDIAEWQRWNMAVLNWEFCEEISFINCDFRGLKNGVLVSGGRRMRFNGNAWQTIAADFHGLTTAFRFTTPRGVFADDRTYVQITDSTAWNNPDLYTGLDSSVTPHGDWLQIRRTGGRAYPTTSAGLNGSTSTPWTVNTVGFNQFDGATGRLYTVVGVTGDGLINPASPPTGTGTGIVSGNVTFDFLMDYTLATEMLVWMENNCIMQDGVSVNSAGNTQPNVQFIINSNSGWLNLFTYAIVNNICGSTNIRGIDGGTNDSNVHAEWNSFVGGAQKSVNNNQGQIRGNVVRAHRNIVGLVSGQPNVVGTTSVAATGNFAANFANGAASPNRPGDVMRGTFTDLNGGLGWGYTITDDGTVTAAEFRSAMSKQMHHLTGAAGARLREVHTITLGPESYELVISE
jgi:hypothetical protein